MKIEKSILPIIVLQFVPLLLFPPALLKSGWAAVIVLLMVYAVLVYFLMRGKAWALTLSIFLQGLNIVVRIMMFFPNSVHLGVWDWPYVLTSLGSILLSGWFLFRLDRPDIRALVT